MVAARPPGRRQGISVVELQRSIVGLLPTPHLPSSTTDATVNDEANNNQQLQFVNSSRNSGSGSYIVAASGSYPFIIGGGCPSTSGPFQFVVQVTPGHL